MKITKIYLDSLIILNDSSFTPTNKTDLLYEIFKENKIIERIFVSFLIRFNKIFFGNIYLNLTVQNIWTLCGI